MAAATSSGVPTPPGTTGEPGTLRRRSPGAFRPRVPETLRTLYEQYCAHEARELVALLTREGRRSLLREELSRSGGGVERRDAPPSVDAVYRAARRILPLPPYDRWVPLYLENRASYLERLGVPTVPARELPVTVAIRPLEDGWWAHLALRKVEDGWRGGIAFHREPGTGPGSPPGPGPEGAGGDEPAAGSTPGALPGGGETGAVTAVGASGPFCTAEIFRGPDAEELRRRFLDFAPAALSGFLRSALP
jgi:hypothetical protein